MSVTVPRVVLTGGPCGGKTTAIDVVVARLREHGLTVFVAPEAASLVLGAGGKSFNQTDEQRIAVQEAIAKVILATEDAIARLAEQCGKPAVMLCDRGMMDAVAYLPGGAWSDVANRNGWNLVALRDARYDAVIHMVTAADGAPDQYRTHDHAVRYETAEQAVTIDQRLQRTWLGHPHLRVIECRADFGEKLSRAADAVCHALGVPQPIEIERKFLVAKCGDMPVPYVDLEIEQTYLTSGTDAECRVRKRSQDGQAVYYHTIKRRISKQQREEIERRIDAEEYAALMRQADPARCTIHKTRRVFLHGGRMFEMDIYRDPRPGLQVIEIELDYEGEDVALPPWIEIDSEITGDKAYANATIALDG
jgi:CYTH domain-containing protein/predicted ATPase